MKILTTRLYRWGGEWGDTHAGHRVFLFGWIPVWQVKRKIERNTGDENDIPNAG